MKIIPPGSVIGILGGGQLGRMTAMAAAQLGYSVHIYCPEADEPAVAVSAFHTQAGFDDVAALREFAEAVDIVTLEWENVPIKALETVVTYTDVFPQADVLRVAQDREQEKSFARKCGLGTADFQIVYSEDELAAVLKSFSLPAILKSTRMGYDGKGQVKITAGMDAATAWREMGSDVGILEAFVAFDYEVSVIVVRRVDGLTAAFPAVRNEHRNQILFETRASNDLDPIVAKEAKDVAVTLAEKLGIVGLLAVELFVLKQPNSAGQRVLVNEIAPRPHNSGHWTMDACACSQFEQLVRAICGLPLGSTTPHSRAVMRNLIGDDVKAWADYLSDPSASLHLYGKTEARDGRKMGHVNFLNGRW
jgi:5-(carboxyamino)imidazole ribonucleotide synthase